MSSIIASARGERLRPLPENPRAARPPPAAIRAKRSWLHSGHPAGLPAGCDAFDFGDGLGLIVIPGTRLKVNLDHNQGGDDHEDRQEERRRDAGPVLRRHRVPHKFLGLAQLVVNCSQLGLELIDNDIGVRRGADAGRTRDRVRHGEIGGC